jgi:hypothetical protein
VQRHIGIEGKQEMLVALLLTTLAEELPSLLFEARLARNLKDPLVDLRQGRRLRSETHAHHPVLLVRIDRFREPLHPVNRIAQLQRTGRRESRSGIENLAIRDDWAMRSNRDRHRHSADVHADAADRHEKAAEHWDDRNDPERAELERRNAEIEREATQLERDRVELVDRRGPGS